MAIKNPYFWMITLRDKETGDERELKSFRNEQEAIKACREYRSGPGGVDARLYRYVRDMERYVSSGCQG